MEILNIEQGSEEWLNARRGIPTASNFSKIIQNNGKKSTQENAYCYLLASQILSHCDDELQYTNAAMERGTELEPDARAAYEQYAFNPVEQVGFIKNYGCGYSPDGLVGADGLIEIKCPNQATHTKYLYNNVIPSEYFAQVQGGLYITGRAWCDFVSFHPNFKGNKKIFIIRVYRDEEFIDKLGVLLKEFNAKRDLIVKTIRSK